MRRAADEPQNSQALDAALARTLVVLPALNEQDSIGAVLDEVRRELPAVDCLVVDDGSTDRTGDVARMRGVPVAVLPYNLGVGGAMRLGFRYALSHGYDNVVQIDADGQHDPRSVRAVVGQLDRFDLVIGARFAGEGQYAVRGPRKWAMVLLARVLSRAARTKLTDATSGLKASGPRAVRLFAEHYPAEYLGDTVEALVIAARARCRITQVPVAMRARAGGTPSHNPLKSARYLLRAVVALGFAFIRPPVRAGEEARSS